MTSTGQKADQGPAAGPAAWDWTRPSIVLGLATIAVHLFVNSGYGFFRDELYFIVCGNHPAWGYVDQPPLVPLIASLSHDLFGDFLVGFRFAPMLAMAGTVALTAEFARMLGGGRFAQWLAGLCALFAPILLILGVLVYTDMFQALTWLGLVWVLVRLEQTGDERWWLAFGAIAGFSLQTKYAIAFFLIALAIGLLVTPQRRSLLRPWVYLGALLAGLIVLPNVWWQEAHGWPFLELAKAGANGKNAVMSPLAYFAQQFLQVGPLGMLVALCGLWAGVVRPQLLTARALAIAWLALFAFFVYAHGKPYYLVPIYPALLGFGAQRIEQWFSGKVVRGAALAAVAVVGVVIAPLTLPILPVETFLRYQRAIGITPSVGERQTTAVLPQYYADMFGWREMAAKVAKVYWSLPPKDRARAVFFGNNYGEAAAIDVFGRRLGLPPAISGHNNYYLWGPRGHDGSVVIIIGGSTEHYASLFRSYTVAGRIDNPYAMPYETNKPIYVLRGMKVPLQTYWPQTKHYE
ncbi:MAG: glycosyltransferase family 39 protein [Alphaproteobacteria bacterium]|nr:glycosyltransferase family 39 protein [Alphaproteobacteria bacterium]